MIGVPLEIWIYITKFIPDNDLYNLRGVCRVFFDLAIDAQWSKTRISSDITWYKTLQRLSDPFIASRVSNLSTYLTHDKSTAQDINQLHRILRNRIRDSHNVICNIFRDKSAESQRKGTTRRCTLKDVIDVVSVSNGNFDNVRELSVDGCLFFSQDPTPLPALSSSFWLPFASNLRSLSLGGTMEEFRFILESGCTFQLLKDLSLRFEQSYDGEGDLSVLVDSVAPFVNAVGSGLEKLTIWSRSLHLDLSAFFASLSSFPRLRDFKIKMPFPQSLRNPAGLEAIIRDTSCHLKQLCIRHCLDSSRTESDAFLELWDMSFTRWLLQYVAKKDNLPCVTVVDIYSLYLPAGVEVLLDIIYQAPHKLTEVIVRNRLLSREEADVIDAVAVCSNLAYLRIPIQVLDLNVLDYLANKLPNLSKLYLAIGPENSPQCSEELKKLQKKRYVHWKLRDISIWDHEGHQKLANILLALAPNIPSVRSFFGTGHMNLG